LKSRNNLCRIPKEFYVPYSFHSVNNLKLNNQISLTLNYYTDHFFIDGLLPSL